MDVAKTDVASSSQNIIHFFFSVSYFANYIYFCQKPGAFHPVAMQAQRTAEKLRFSDPTLRSAARTGASRHPSLPSRLGFA